MSDLDLFNRSVAAAAARFERSSIRYANDPVAWATQRAGQFVWSKQRDILEGIRDHRRVAVHSCHGVGKSFAAATVAAWWIDAHPVGEAFVVTTAPTAPQVKAILWREINRLHRHAGLPGRVNLTEWYLDGELVAIGRKPSEYDEAAFQGIHAMFVLVIIDEASGVPATLWTAAESIATNRHSRILAIGNPDLGHGDFHEAITPGSGWHTIHIGYEHTPAYTGEEVPATLLDLLVSPEWVEERRAKWTEKSALWYSKVLGLPPPTGGDPWVVIPHDMVTLCRWLNHPDGEPHEAGVDVGGGGDRTIVVERLGTKVGRIVSFVDADPMATVGKIGHTLAEWGVSKVKVDTTGIGWGIAGRLRETSSAHDADDPVHGARVVGVNFGAKATQPRRFKNRRAELWWNGRELSRTGGWDLSALDDDAIFELTEPRYKITDSNGKVQIESKDDVIARLGRSPDVADALLLAFDDQTAAQVAEVGAVGTYARSTIYGAGAGGAGGVSPFGRGTGSGRGIFGR